MIKGYSIYIIAIFHVVADYVSFATTFSFFKQTSSLIHFVASLFKNETTTLGFVFECRPVGSFSRKRENIDFIRPIQNERPPPYLNKESLLFRSGGAIFYLKPLH